MRHATTFDVRQFTKEINEYDIKTSDGIRALESHIRKCWMISEIIWFHPFLHGGTFQSKAGWKRTQYGVMTQTREEDEALARLFDGLLSDCHTNMGAAAILRMHNSRFLSGYAITNGGNGPHVYELTLAELAAEIPDEYRKQLDLLSRMEELKQQGNRIETKANEVRQGIGVLVQHLPDAEKPTVISWDEATAIMRQKGGDMTDRTGRNWIKMGKAAKTGTPISWNDLTTVQSWSAWVDTYLAALRSRASSRKFISEHAATVDAESSRRKSPTA